MIEKPKIGNLNLGFLSEKEVQCKLIELGFLTLEPLIEGGNIDMLSYKNNRFKRLQIKTSVFMKKENRFKLVLTRTYHQKYDLKEIDYFITYIYELDIFYVIPAKLLAGVKSINLYPHRKIEKRHKTTNYEKYKNNFKTLEK